MLDVLLQQENPILGTKNHFDSEDIVFGKSNDIERWKKFLFLKKHRKGLIWCFSVQRRSVFS